MTLYDKIFTWSNRVCKVESLPNLNKEGRCAMNTYEILSLLFFGGNFLVALLTYIDRNNKRK